MTNHLSKPLPGAIINPLHPLSQDIIGFWLFNEGAGSLVNDLSGNGNHGTLTNMLPNVHGSYWHGSKYGGSLCFDGTNDYVDCGSKANLSNVDKISIEAWIIKDALHAGAPDEIIAKGYDYIMEFDDAHAYMFSHDNVAGQAVNAAYNYVAHVGKLTHLVGTIDPTVNPQALLYLNGVLVDTGHNAAYTQIGNGASSVYIGNNASVARLLSGNVDLIRMYTRIISPFEVKQLYHDPFCMLQ